MYIKRPASFILTNTDHGTMIVNRHDHHTVSSDTFGVGHQLLSNSSFDATEIQLALKLLQKRRQHFGANVVAIDCGANIGVHTIEWAKLMTHWGVVHSFEAQEKIFYALAGNIALNNCLNVHAQHAAVSNKPGMLDIPEPDYTKPASFGSIELEKRENPEFVGQQMSSDRTQQIRTVSIDSLQLNRLDFMKVDVEGMEEKVLEGARQTIQTHKPVILIEIIKSDQQAVDKFLTDRNYSTFNLGINLLAVNQNDPVLKTITFNGNSLSIT